jgi:hypothetical protein
LDNFILVGLIALVLFPAMVAGVLAGIGTLDLILGLPFDLSARPPHVWFLYPVIAGALTITFAFIVPPLFFLLVKAFYTEKAARQLLTADPAVKNNPALAQYPAVLIDAIVFVYNTWFTIFYPPVFRSTGAGKGAA